MVPIRKLLSVAAAVLCATLLVAAPAHAARNLDKVFWGPAEQSGVSQFPIYRDLGVTVFGDTLSWSDVAKTRPADPTNPADPAYSWPDLDAKMADAQANGISYLFQVLLTPGWANGGQSPAWAPDDPQDYANFLIAASKRYPSVKRWMVWGEPCNMLNWQPLTYQKYGRRLTSSQKATVRRYALLLDDAYGALKSVSPDNVVIGGNTWSVCDIRPLDWIQNMRLPNGKPPRMDLYGHNPVGFVDRKTPLPPKDHIAELRQTPLLQQYVDRYLGRPNGARIDVWLSEFFLPTVGNPNTSFVVTPAQQPKFIKEALRLARHYPRVRAFGYIHLYDSADNGNAGLLTADGTKKSAYYAFKRG